MIVAGAKKGIDVVQHLTQYPQGELLGDVPESQVIRANVLKIIDTLNASGNRITGLYLEHEVGGDTDGGRDSFFVRTFVTGERQGSALGDGMYASVVGQANGMIPVTHGQSLYGGNFYGRVEQHCNGWRNVTAAEFNTDCQSPVAIKTGAQVVSQGADKCRGTQVDAAYAIGACAPDGGTGITGYTNGILFTGEFGANPIIPGGNYFNAPNYRIDANGSSEIGIYGQANTVFWDFHTGAIGVDRDSRLYAYGGNGTDCGGTIGVEGNFEVRSCASDGSRALVTDSLGKLTLGPNLNFLLSRIRRLETLMGLSA